MNLFVNCFHLRDEGVQLASIDLFNGLLKSLPVNEIFPILKSIAKLRHQSSVLLRDKMYEIFMWIFDTYRYVMILFCQSFSMHFLIVLGYSA